VVDMAGDMRGCGPLDVGNGRMGFHVDNGMDFFGLFSNWLTCVPPLPRCFWKCWVLKGDRGKSDILHATNNILTCA
jgi:hypothetical protein